MAKKQDERKELQALAEREAKHLSTLDIPSDLETQQDYVNAGELRKDIKRSQSAIDIAKKKITGPLNEALKNVRALFRPWEDSATLALRSLDGAMTRFERREEQARRDEEARLRKIQEREREKATRRAEKAAEKAEEKGDTIKAVAIRNTVSIAPPPVVIPSSVPKIDGMGNRKAWKFRLAAPEQQKQLLRKAIASYNAGLADGQTELMPAEYWSIDEKTLGSVVRSTKGQIDIPGVEVFSETIRPTRAS